MKTKTVVQGSELISMLGISKGFSISLVGTTGFMILELINLPPTQNQNPLEKSREIWKHIP